MIFFFPFVLALWWEVAFILESVGVYANGLDTTYIKRKN